MLSRFISILILALSIISCSKKEQVYQPTKNIDPYILYKEGYDAFE